MEEAVTTYPVWYLVVFLLVLSAAGYGWIIKSRKEKDAARVAIYCHFAEGVTIQFFSDVGYDYGTISSIDRNYKHLWVLSQMRSDPVKVMYKDVIRVVSKKELL